MNKGKIVLGALAGLAIGSIVGILFAPEKGARTRRNLLNKSEDYLGDAKEKVEDYLASFKKKYDSVVQNTDHLLKKETMNQDEVNSVIS